MLLGSRLQYRRLSHRCLRLLVLGLGRLQKIGKDTNHWVVTEYDHSWSSQVENQCKTIHRLSNSERNKERVNSERRQSAWPVRRNGGKSDSSNGDLPNKYQTTFKALLSIASTDQVVWYLQCGMWRSRPNDVVCFLLGNSPASEFYMPTFRNTLFHLRRQVGAPTCLWRWNRHSVPKRLHIKFRRRGITQKKSVHHSDHGESLESRSINDGVSFVC